MLITFSLFWTVIKNNILYVIRTGDVDGGGLFFPNAINQTFTGLYFLEICLIGLFFLVKDQNGKFSCKAQGIIMAVVLLVTICYQIWLNLNFSALYQYAPIRLEVEVGRKQREAEEAERLTDEKDEAIAQFDGDASDATTSRPTTAEFDVPQWVGLLFSPFAVLRLQIDIDKILAMFLFKVARNLSISIATSSLSTADDAATGRRQNRRGGDPKQACHYAYDIEQVPPAWNESIRRVSETQRCCRSQEDSRPNQQAT